MSSDQQTLTDMNIRIGQAESEGDRDWLAGIFAPELAFLRADGRTVDDLGRFLQKVAKSEPRPTSIESVEILGNRAIVKCVVTVKSPEGDKRIHNLRLFVRMEGAWRLLAWANERM
jgi:hypothetical protein